MSASPVTQPSSSAIFPSSNHIQQQISSQQSIIATPNDALLPAPEVQVNGKPASAAHGLSVSHTMSYPSNPSADDSSTWGSNFWVTLADPQTGVSFFACPATGEVSWDPPVGNFLLPPSPDGEWWEMTDEASGLPYYYHTKAGETVWERPTQAFVIPLSVLQNTALGRRLSLNNRRSQTYDDPVNGSPSVRQARRRSRHISEYDHQQLHRPALPSRRSHSSTRSSPARVHAQSLTSTPSPSARYRDLRQSTSSSAQHPLNYNPVTASPLSYQRGHPLAPIPGSPYATDSSPPATPSGRKSSPSTSLKAKGNASGNKGDGEAEVGEGSPRKRKSTLATSTTEFGGGGSASSSPGGKNSANRKSVAMVPYRPPQPQSLTAALEIIALQTSPSGSPEDKEKNTRKGKEKGWERGKEKGEKEGEGRARSSTNTSQNSSHSQPSQSQHSQHSQHSQASSSSSWRLKQKLRPRIITSTFEMQNPAVASAQTSTPTPPDSPTSPLRGRGKARWKVGGGANGSVPPSPTTRRTMLGGGGNKSAMEGPGQGILLRGKEISSPMLAKGDPFEKDMEKCTAKPIPVEPTPADLYRGAPPRRVSLNTGMYPVLPDDLASDIQQFSESQFAKQYFSTHRTGFIFRRRVPVEQMMTWQKTPLHTPLLQLPIKSLHKDAVRIFKAIQKIMGDKDKIPHNGSTASLVGGTPASILEEQRWLLGQGLTHGALRDEIYCQVMKQSTGNPSTESTFRGWQLFCVLLVTFPPSKDFEPSLRSYLHQATNQSESRVDVMAKYCLRRLGNISRKGPRGKPPSLTEIESAADAAFHPSIFGESLDVIFRLQERNYSHLRIPIILPFLADGILALGGTKSEGIFRIPGDSDSVSELKLRIDKGYYTLDGFDDPTVLASLLKLWLRELCDPLIPEELYNDCITHSKDPEACVEIVKRLPTINRRVVLFVVSFLQGFLEEKVMLVTKMTSANLALVMAPNLLRCSSESIAVVFTNAQYEQTFVYNLLVHLKCAEVDPEYVPTHGHGAVPPELPPLRKSKSRRR